MVHVRKNRMNTSDRLGGALGVDLILNAIIFLGDGEDASAGHRFKRIILRGVKHADAENDIVACV